MVRVWEWINTAFVWEFKRDFVKAVIRRAVRLPRCLFRELPLYGNNEGCTCLRHFFFYLYFTKYLEPRISSHLSNFLNSGTKFYICIIKKGSRVCKTKANIWIKFITALSVLRNWVTYISFIWTYTCHTCMASSSQMYVNCRSNVLQIYGKCMANA